MADITMEVSNLPQMLAWYGRSNSGDTGTTKRLKYLRSWLEINPAGFIFETPKGNGRRYGRRLVGTNTRLAGPEIAAFLTSTPKRMERIEWAMRFINNPEIYASTLGMDNPAFKCRLPAREVDMILRWTSELTHQMFLAVDDCVYELQTDMREATPPQPRRIVHA